MANITFSGLEEYGQKLQELADVFESGEVLERAAQAGADPVADEIRKRLDKLPPDSFRRLEDGEKFDGLPVGNHLDLLDSLGVTPPDRDKNGFVHVKVGWDGYGSRPTKAYPHGVPNQLLARAVESGSPVREKTPFVRPAVNATREEAVAAMEKSVDDDIKKIFKE